MRIKKFTGTSLKEASELMKRELGENAIILNTKRIPSPNGGIEEYYEIIGALDEHAGSSNQNSAAKKALFSKLGEYERVADSLKTQTEKTKDLSPIEHLRQISETITEQRKSPVKQTISAKSTDVQEVANYFQLKGELEDVKHMLMTTTEKLQYTNSFEVPQELKRIYKRLVDHDVDETIAHKIVSDLHTNLSGEALTNVTIIEGAVLQKLEQIFPIAPAVKQVKQTRIMAFVGPTGVGKTTTIAKIAAINKLFNNKDVALITADTYRIAAIEQLQTFADIANIPMEVVYSPEEMKKAIRKLSKAQLILIDTVGRSQRGEKELAQLRRFLTAANPDEIHLVVSATTSTRLLRDILQHFKTLKPNRLVFSKIDEALSAGSLLSVEAELKLPLSFVTTGQSVPDDIMPAEAPQLARMTLHGVTAYA